MKRLFFLLIILFYTKVALGLPFGDTHGVVAAVTVDHSYNRDYDSFLIWFENTENDRWKCIENDGYIRVRTNGVGMNETNFKLMYSMALAALASEKKLAVSHSGSNPCINANGSSIRK